MLVIETAAIAVSSAMRFFFSFLLYQSHFFPNLFFFVLFSEIFRIIKSYDVIVWLAVNEISSLCEESISINSMQASN